MGCEVLVAQSADLLRITESVTKNDDNDAMELAAYMRRRLNGEDEFRTVVMTPPEIMAKKMFIRAIYVDKTYLSECKKRLRFRLKVMGADLRREYKDISCERSLTQLRERRGIRTCATRSPSSERPSLASRMGRGTSRRCSRTTPISISL